MSFPGQFSSSVYSRRLARDSFNIYFWYVVLQEFIQIVGLYFLHEDFFLFSKWWELNNELREDVINPLFSFFFIDSFLLPLVYTVVICFMDNTQLWAFSTESDTKLRSLEWAEELAFLHVYYK